MNGSVGRNDDHIKQNEEEMETQEPLLGSDNCQPKIMVSGMPTSAQSHQNGRSTLAEDGIIKYLIGDTGFWQKRTTFFVFLTKIPAAWFMACIIFTAPAPYYGEYFCDLSEIMNLTENNDTTSFHPIKINADGEYESNFCQVYTNITGDSAFNALIPALLGKDPHQEDFNTVPCKHFAYNVNPMISLVTQFDLVCSDGILVAVTQVFHLFGVLLGGIAATYAMGYFSPRRVMMSGMILQIVCGLVTGYAPWFWFHVAFRCLSATCCALTFTPGSVIMNDITGGKYKTIINANFEQFWPIGVMLLPAIDYATNNWTEIYIFITMPTVLIMFFWIWIPDSPKWYLERGLLKEAKKILLHGSEINKKRLGMPDNLDKLLEDQSTVFIKNKAEDMNTGWYALFSVKGAWWRIIFVITSWCLMYTCYYGTLLNIRSFGREYLHMNTAIAGTAEIIGGLVGFAIIMKTKYKWVLIGGFTAITGIVNFLIWLLPTNPDGSHMLIDLMCLAMLNKIGISASLCVLYTCTADLFPAPHKRRVVFACTVMARIIFMTAPLIGYTATVYGDGISLMSFGILTLVSGILTLTLSPLKVKSNNKVMNIYTLDGSKNNPLELNKL